MGVADRRKIEGERVKRERERERLMQRESWECVFVCGCGCGCVREREMDTFHACINLYYCKICCTACSQEY